MSATMPSTGCIGPHRFRTRGGVVCVRFWLFWLTLGVLGSAWGDPAAFPKYQAETARDYLLTVMKAIPAQAGSDAEVCGILARAQSQLGDKIEAERLARQALELDPRRAEMQSFLATLFIQQDRMEEAARSLREAVRLKPEDAREYRQLGMVLDRLGDRPGARDAFETALRLRPGDATGRLLLGRWLLDQDQPAAAAAQLERACQLDPKLSGAFYALSQARARLGDATGAREVLKTYQALRDQEKAALDAKNAAVDNEKGMRILTAGLHTELASALLRLRHPDLAEKHLLQAVRIAPREPRAYEMLFTIFLQAGRLADARGVGEDLVRLWPERAIYRANLGTLLWQLKDPKAALAELKRALVLDSKQPVALANLARFYLTTGQDLPEGLALARRLVEADPSAAHYDMLGWALYANGQIDAARQASAQAVARAPDNPVYRERQRKLQPTP